MPRGARAVAEGERGRSTREHACPSRGARTRTRTRSSLAGMRSLAVPAFVFSSLLGACSTSNDRAVVAQDAAGVGEPCSPVDNDPFGGGCAPGLVCSGERAPGKCEACGAVSPAGPPTQHRPSPISCPVSPPVGVYGVDGGACATVADCMNIGMPQGLPATCIPYEDAGGTMFCNYDTCHVDSDCRNVGGGPCACEATNQGAGNYCYGGNCQVDSDCGDAGFCSPARTGVCNTTTPAVTGFYCHTAKDQCANDSDCASCGAASYCTYSSEVGAWSCAPALQYPPCAG